MKFQDEKFKNLDHMVELLGENEVFYLAKMYYRCLWYSRSQYKKWYEKNKEKKQHYNKEYVKS